MAAAVPANFIASRRVSFPSLLLLNCMTILFSGRWPPGRIGCHEAGDWSGTYTTRCARRLNEQSRDSNRRQRELASRGEVLGATRLSIRVAAEPARPQRASGATSMTGDSAWSMPKPKARRSSRITASSTYTRSAEHGICGDALCAIAGLRFQINMTKPAIPIAGYRGFPSAAAKRILTTTAPAGREARLSRACLFLL